MPSISVTKPINGPGWYLISSSIPVQQGEELKSFYEVIHSLKSDAVAEINIYKAAFYYPYAFSPDDSFTSADWNRVEDINEYYIPDGTQDGSRSYLYRMSPNLGYWVKIESYSPKISLPGDTDTVPITNVSAELYNVFVPPAATSSGGESVSVDVSNIPVDSNNNTVSSLGTYTIIYSVANNVGDVSTRSLSVTVSDPSPPIITIPNQTIYLNTTSGVYASEFNVKDLLIDNSYILLSDSNTPNEHITVTTSPETFTNPDGSFNIDISANDGYNTSTGTIDLVFMSNPVITPIEYSNDPDNGYLGITSNNKVIKLNDSSDINAENLVSVGADVTVTYDPQNITDSTTSVTYNATHTASGFTNTASYSVIRVDGPTLDATFISNDFVYGPSSDVIYVKNNVIGTSVNSDIFMTTNGTLSSTPAIIEASSNTYNISYVATDTGNYGFKSEKTISVVTVDAPNIDVVASGSHSVDFVYGPSNDTIYIQDGKGVSASGELFVDVSDNVTLTSTPIEFTQSDNVVNYLATDPYGFTNDASLSITTVTSPNIGIKELGDYANFVYGPSNDTIYIQADKGVSASGELFVDVSNNVTLTSSPIEFTQSDNVVNYVATDQYGFTSDASLSIVTVQGPTLTPSSELIYPDNSSTIDYTKPYWLNDSNETTLMAPIDNVTGVNALTYVNALSDYTIDVSSSVVTDTSFANLSTVSDPSYSVITYTLTQNTYGFETDISYNVTIRTDIAPPIITGPSSLTLLDPNP